MARLWSLTLFVSCLFMACLPPQPLKIGFLAGLTGSAAELGNGARKAVDMVVRDLNQSGGIGGRPLELVVMDDQNQPRAGLEAYEEFHRQKVIAVVGPVASTVIETILPYLNEHRLLTVSPTVSAASVAGLDDWFFRVITLNKAMGEDLARYALGRGLTDVAVLRETSNNAYTMPILEAFRARLEAAGGRVRAAVEFDLRKDPDYAALSRQLGQASTYLILASGHDSALIGQQLAQVGRMEPLLCPPWAMTPDVISLGGRQVERMVFVSIYDPESREPSWLSFRDSFKALYGEEPGFSSVYAHDAMTLLISALSRSRSTSPDDVRAAMVALGEVKGLQSPFHLDASGDVVRDLFFLSIRDGRFLRARQ